MTAKKPSGGFIEHHSPRIPTPIDEQLSIAEIAIAHTARATEEWKGKVFDAIARRLRASDSEKISAAQQAEAEARKQWELAQVAEGRARVTHSELARQRADWLRIEGTRAPVQPQPSDR